jgi:hypothetical protein
MINPIRNDNNIVIVNKRLLDNNFLNCNEFWLLVQICSKMDNTNSCILDNNELKDLTSWGIDKILKVRYHLVGKGLIILTEIKPKNGKLATNISKITYSYQIPSKL